MSIDSRCKEQQSVADQMFKEQVRALSTLSFLVGMWSDFLVNEEKRMSSALSLEASS